MTTRYHTHGQQLGWHALFLAAGKLLGSHPVTGDSWYDDPWGEWLSGYGLTRDDGLWLSDGTDRPPHDTAERLLERKRKEVVITGNRERILALASLESGVGETIVVEGRWTSADNVAVHISSALVPTRKAATLARQLTREDPMVVWVPCLADGEGAAEVVRDEKKDYTPWIVRPHVAARLDRHDPYGVSVACFRPRVGHDVAACCSLSRDDPFGRAWTDERGRPVLWAQAWGREGEEAGDEPSAGARLVCTSSLLRKILTKCDKELLVLIRLGRYERETGRSGSRYTHTVAVARITSSREPGYFKGRINHVYKSR